MTYQARRARGLCATCPNAVQGHVRCLGCRLRQAAAYKRKRRAAQLAKVGRVRAKVGRVA